MPGLTGEGIFTGLFAGRPWAAWLDSAGGPPWQARRSLFASDPAVTLTWAGESGVVRDARGREERLGGNPLDGVRRLLRELAPAGEGPAGGGRGPAGGSSGPVPFPGGAIGYFAYDLARRLERLPSRARADAAVPDCCLAFYPAGVVLDHRTGEAGVWTSPLRGFEDLAEERREALEAGLARVLRGRSSAVASDRPGRVPRGGSRAPGPDRAARAGGDAGEAPGGEPGPDRAAAEWSMSRAQYLDAVARAREHIRAGDIYQVNLSRRLRARWRGDPLSLYLRLRRLLPEPYAAFLDFPGAAVLSASPELFLKVTGDRVVTRPIKGTRPRGTGRGEDRRLRRELAASPKDRAELLMIVDLERNDLGKVCRPGSVRVPSLWTVERHPAAHQMVATVEGRLRPGVGPVDVLEAAFPGGSITGAPKRRAMEIIEELEPVRRGVYTGALGYIGFDGSMELSIVIRTLVAGPGWVDLQVGGGIVADSVPEQEYEETLVKARGLLEALGLA